MRGSAIFAMVLLLGASACAGQTPQSDETNASAAAGDTASGPPPGPPPPLDFPPLEIGTAPEHDYTDAQIARGAELVLFGGCNDCHTIEAIGDLDYWRIFTSDERSPRHGRHQRPSAERNRDGACGAERAAR